MLRNIVHPLYHRQAAPEARDNKNALPAEAIKSEAAQMHMGGFYPPVRLAQAYVIWQKYGPVFSPAEGLEKGTIFPELYSPYPY